MPDDAAHPPQPPLAGRYEMALATNVGWIAPRAAGENLFTLLPLSWR